MIGSNRRDVQANRWGWFRDKCNVRFILRWLVYNWDEMVTALKNLPRRSVGLGIHALTKNRTCNVCYSRLSVDIGNMKQGKKLLSVKNI
jgi:hypothetical protein